MGLEFAILALLPLGLLSFFDKQLRTYRGAVAGWLPLAIAGASALIGGIKQHKANKAAKQAAQLDNANTAAQDAAKAKLLSDLRASGWDPTGINTLSGDSSSSTTQNSTTRMRGSSDTYRTTLAENQAMENKLRELVMSRIAQPQQITAGEKMAAVRGFDTTGATAALRNLAGARGLSAQQLQAAGTPLAVNRANQIATYLGQTVPGLERELATQARGEADSFLNARAGSHTDQESVSNTTGTSNTVGRSSHQQGPDISTALALMTPGAQVSTNTGNSALLSGANSLLGGLATYYGNRGVAPANNAGLRLAGGLAARQNVNPLYPGLRTTL